MHKRSLGFTLTEFAVTLGVAALFLTMAVPSYYTMMQNNRAVSTVNKLAASLNLARMEAIKRGVKVSVCAAGNAALTTCGNSSQWAQGWIVFLDPDNNNTIDSNNDLLKVTEALPAGTTVTSNQAVVSYDSSGFVSSGVLNMSMSASGCQGNNARQLTLSATGRLSVAKANCS